MGQENEIIWLKWEDPMAQMLHRHEEMPDLHEDFADIRERESNDSFVKAEEPYYNKTNPVQTNTGPAIISPMGLIPIHESNLPGYLYNFWIGHTNFSISKKWEGVIKKVPGVETLNIFTRYRFRVAIGKYFDQTEVKKSVIAAVNPPPKPKPVVMELDGLTILQRDLEKKFDYWAIHIMPDNRLEVISGEK